MEELHGQNLIAGESSALGASKFRAFNPLESRPLDPEFIEATESEVDAAAESALEALGHPRLRDAASRAELLRRMAEKIEALGDRLILRASRETGLPEVRLTGERGRTVNQLRMFAQLVEEGSWAGVRIDRSDPDRQPLPRPDIRRMLIALGPVAVFGASNFPLAFSVAGGDTASALAGGNPVVVKAHPAHPGTSELVGQALTEAVSDLGFPPGVFSLIHGVSHAISIQLVRHRCIRAVGFTGSFTGGRAIFEAALSREEPIPVHAEMGSTNPLFLMPGALTDRGEKIARGLHQSVNLGVGQFCTNPGVVVLPPEDEHVASFLEELRRLFRQTAPGTMLHAGIRNGFLDRFAHFRNKSEIALLGESTAEGSEEATEATAGLFMTGAESFVADRDLQREIFGPATLLVRCSSDDDYLRVAGCLEGHLTATIHARPEELSKRRELVDMLRGKVGRLIFNGFPTGVEVCHSMQHGGPWPATTDSRSTSVGTAAIERFVRPVCYQDFPQELLPDELKDSNPKKIWRLVEGEWTRESL